VTSPFVLNYTDCCWTCYRQTFMSWWTAGASGDLSLPRLTAAEFLLQTSRWSRQHWRARSMGADERAFWF